MNRIYSVLRPPIDEKKPYVDWAVKNNQKLSTSPRGLIAFTSSFCLNRRQLNSISYHVYVADVNTPYEPYLIQEGEHEITILEWDPSGTKLLIADTHGNVTIYTSKDFLVSDWRVHSAQQFTAEYFVSAAWYHQGIVTTINVANQNLQNPSNHLDYSDKIQQTRFGASLRTFGGKASEGCLLISRSGLVVCLTLIADGTVDVLVEGLGPIRQRIEVADICHHKDGSFVVASSAGSINSTISLCQIYLKTMTFSLDEVDSFSANDGKRIQMKSYQYYSFHLNIMSQIYSERETPPASFGRVAHIKFVTQDSPQDLLVEVSGPDLSLIELWEIEPKNKQTVHPDIKILKQNPTIKLEENGGKLQCTTSPTKEWSFKGNYILDKNLATITTPKFKIFGQSRQLDIILLAYKDSTIRCLRKDDLQQIGESISLSNFSHDCRQNGSVKGLYPYVNRHLNGISNNLLPNSNNIKAFSNDKRYQKNIFITDIKLSCNQTVFFAVDSASQIHAIKMPPLMPCHDQKDHQAYLQYILEYCLVTGNDWWDAIVCAEPNSIEAICDKFHDAYERQPKHIQKKYSNRQLVIRASLYRCLNDVNSLCKASDCHTTIMLNSVANTLKSMLRSQDQDSPAESLSNFLRSQQGVQPNFFNCNNVISKIQEKEFYVEVNLSQCLQPLSQWVVDLATYLMVSLTYCVRDRTPYPGTGIMKSKEALETIRELLVIIKIWGIQNESSLPVVYKLSDQFDAIGTLFRLVSMAYTSMSQQEPDESLLKECRQFANEITMGQFRYVLEPTGVASPLITQQNSSQAQETNTKFEGITLKYFSQPDMPELVQLPQIEGCINMNGDRKIDAIRNISLGAHPVLNIRHCTRCKSVSQLRATINSARVWEQRWIGNCVCGGSWAQSDVTFGDKVGQLVVLHQNSTLNSFQHPHPIGR